MKNLKSLTRIRLTKNLSLRSTPWLIGWLLSLMGATLPAQQISVQLSSEQAYVGQPITLEIQISDANEIKEPALPAIDGLTIKLGGTPARRIVTTIVNNRRSQTQSVTYRFLLTPQRAGEFQIPPFSLTVDGKVYEIESKKIQANVSETGDLLFVEIESPLSRVYVGQPLPLTLKIFIRPFTDDDRKIRLTERDMWQLLGRRQDWGIFSKRLQELAEKRQRPAGNLVYRENDDGTKVPYILYEIETTFYPQRPGPINVSDIVVAAEYPTQLGRSRGVSSVFDDDAWQGFDRLFGDSPFRADRLSVTATRPITATAQPPQIDVVDIPTAGRPVDYRGAVGKYKISAIASAQEVTEGDPINLQLIIQGEGPLDSLLGPSLTGYQPLNQNFLVNDDPAAGIVRDDLKLFWTTIRPKHTEVTEIPPLPFSFFDPIAEEFRTVYSDSIPIKVLPGDSLLLDSISTSSAWEGVSSTAGTRSSDPINDWKANFSHALYSPDEILAWTPPRDRWRTWVWILPPCGYLIWLAWIGRSLIFSMVPGAEQKRLLSAVRKAKNCGELAMILERSCGDSLNGNLADIHRRCLKAAYGKGQEESVSQLRGEAEQAIRALDGTSFNCRKQTLASSQLAKLLLGVTLLGLSAAAHPSTPTASQPRSDFKPLTAEQQRKMLLDADRWLQQGIHQAAPSLPAALATNADAPKVIPPATNQTAVAGELSETQPLDRIESLNRAIERYQAVLADGYRNPRLLKNLGYAYLVADNLLLATVSFEHAWRLDPYDHELVRKIKFLKTKLFESEHSPEHATEYTPTWQDRVMNFNQWMPAKVSRDMSLGIWVICWGWLAVSIRPLREKSSRQKNRRYFVPRYLWVGTIVAGILCWLSWQANLKFQMAFDGVTIQPQVSVHAADDKQFPVVGTLTLYQPIRQSATRGEWVEISPIQADFSGWVKIHEIYSFR